MFQVEGTLPVALKALDGQTEIKSKKIVMRQMTAIEYIQSQASIEGEQYIAISDLAAMTKLVDEDGKEHAITYDMLGNSSRSNLDYLNEKIDLLNNENKLISQSILDSVSEEISLEFDKLLDIEFQNEYRSDYLLEKEKEVFGFYLSSHPTNLYKKDNPYCIPLNEIAAYFSKRIDTLILVDKIKTINTKNGDRMAFLTGSDETSTMEYTLFPKVYKEYSDIKKGDLLKVRGTVEKRLNQLQIVVEKIRNLKETEN